jgi:hypothetical protein
MDGIPHPWTFVPADAGPSAFSAQGGAFQCGGQCGHFLGRFGAEM